MGEREIIIADGDARYRSQVTDFFRNDGYRVATADSVEQVLASVQENQTQVLLLGSGFSTKISASDLVHLLKKCSRRLRIILVSDGMPLALARQVRQEGIFYQALKPAAPGDTEELGQAVACAFDKRRASVLAGPTLALQNQPARPGNEEKSAPAGTHLMKSMPWVAALVAALYSIGSAVLGSPGEKAQDGFVLTSTIFLGFCTIIVAGQLLTIFRIRLAPYRARLPHAMQACTPRGAKWAVAPSNDFNSN